MRVGLLGTGRIGALHAGILAGNPDVEALEIGDVDAGRAGPVREWKVRNDPDHEWLLK